MLYFWWGCRRNLKSITLGSQKIKFPVKANKMLPAFTEHYTGLSTKSWSRKSYAVGRNDNRTKLQMGVVVTGIGIRQTTRIWQQIKNGPTRNGAIGWSLISTQTVIPWYWWHFVGRSPKLGYKPHRILGYFSLCSDAQPDCPASHRPWVRRRLPTAGSWAVRWALSPKPADVSGTDSVGNHRRPKRSRSPAVDRCVNE